MTDRRWNPKASEVSKEEFAIIEAEERAIYEAEKAARFAGFVAASQKALGVDDTEMARIANVSRPTIRRWIQGKSSPHMLTRKAITDAINTRLQNQAT